MHNTLIIIACLSLALGLRLTKLRVTKKLAAILFIFTMFFLGLTLFQHWIGALVTGGFWFFLPLLEIYWKRGKVHYPCAPIPLTSLPEANEAFYPHSYSYRVQLEEIGFEPVENVSWKWMDTNQHHRFFWHPEFLSIASICLCEQENIAFTYIIFHSSLSDGTSLKTTNYPFSPPLRPPPNTYTKHVPCEEKFIPSILAAHQALIAKHNPPPCKLLMPDPESIATEWELRFKKQTQFNAQKGLIHITHQKQFQYSLLGYLQLWGRALLDIIRLC